MSETILKALIQLFALIADLHDEKEISGSGKELLRSFLLRHLNHESTERYMTLFDEYLRVYNYEDIKRGSLKDKKRTSLNAMRILSICEEINRELQQDQKVFVLVQLIDYVLLGPEATENESDFIQTVGNAFFIPDNEFTDIREFITDNATGISGRGKYLVISSRGVGSDDLNTLSDENTDERISFLNVASTNTYLLRYKGSSDIYLNGQIIFPGRTYVFSRGSTIRGSGIKTIYYSDISNRINGTGSSDRISLVARNVSFRFSNSENGVHNLNFRGESGTMIGILGGSGVGKSTTLSILSGTLKPQEGEILINGYNLYERKDKEELNGVIGFVPQDDLLIEEITVYENLYYNARMCLNKLSDQKIKEAVDRILADFDLEEIKDLKVGNPLKKVISGGQRKRVNIALELLRRPTILFVDEPTSGLSSLDSLAVMNLLKEQTYKGKLVIINIHQPSSDIYKMFDKIMIIDRGGYQIFFGNPTEAITYFKSASNHANPDEDQCVKCGNVDTEQLLQIVEAKVVDEHGKATRTRKISPGEWSGRFSEKSGELLTGVSTQRQKLPENYFSIPGLLKQSLIFFLRDLKSKIADKQYILISLFGSPLLALLLAYFTRSGGLNSYSFADNENIPAYLFMCVITSLFLGLMGSSEEIVRDRKILKRESFLNLSWMSYLNSKVVMMFLLSALQTFLFILIGNLILGIKGMTLSYWLILFSTSCFANMLGLNLSSAFDSVITIYILIPFIIIPQLLFSGVLVKFDNLHISNSSKNEYVPVIGDMMIARWSFEALAVKQFRDNAYEKNFFLYDEAINANSNKCIVIDELNQLLNQATKAGRTRGNEENNDNILLKQNLEKLGRNVNYLASDSGLKPGPWILGLNTGQFNTEISKDVKTYLDSLKRKYQADSKALWVKKNMINDELERSLGEEGLMKLRDDYENKQLKRIILNEGSVRLTLATPERIIPLFNPGYIKARANNGRAHYYAPYKRIFGLETDTFRFNLAIIWLTTLILYLMLWTKLLRRAILFSGKQKPGTAI